jgi:aminoglycoside phosphotransferase (APT) family kinase protein
MLHVIDNESVQMDTQLPVIDHVLMRHLVGAQFPQWAHLPVNSIAVGGWDNRSFRLGDDMIVRLPSAAAYAAQVEKEHCWLPRLAPHLSVQIPMPLAIGEPASGYPWRWSIYRWIEGETARPEAVADSSDFASRVAGFLISLQRIDTTGGPPPGPHNFYRGGSLMTYDAETREAIAILKRQIDTVAATNIWETALRTSWNHSPVWIHGDMSVGNLLSRDGQLRGVIDFGMLGIGDPACDLAIAWTLFRGESRNVFRAMLPVDSGTWIRGRAWTLWKALIIAAGLSTTNAIEWSNPWLVIDEALYERKH